MDNRLLGVIGLLLMVLGLVIVGSVDPVLAGGLLLVVVGLFVLVYALLAGILDKFGIDTRDIF